MAQIKLRGVDPSKFAPLPDEILRLTSPQMYYKTKNFDKLTNTEKLSLINHYVEAVKHFAQKASTRIHGQREMKFAREYFPNLKFVDIKNVSMDDTRTLGEFVLDELKRPASPTETRIDPAVHNGPSLQSVQQRIAEVHQAGKQPVIALDLEGSVFLHGSRTVQTLKKYDSEHKTNYFSNVKREDILVGQTDEFLWSRLGEKISDFDKLQETIAGIEEFIRIERNADTSLSSYETNPDVLAWVKGWKEKNAKIVYFSSRPQTQEAEIIAALKSRGIPVDGLIAREPESDEKFTETKLREIDAYSFARPNEEIVLALSDYQKVANGIKDQPGRITKHMIVRQENGLTFSYLIEGPKEAFTLLLDRGCLRATLDVEQPAAPKPKAPAAKAKAAKPKAKAKKKP